MKKPVVLLALVTALAACTTAADRNVEEVVAPLPMPPLPEPMPAPPPPPPPVAYGVMARMAAPSAPMNTERYEAIEPNPVKRVAEEPVSTFSVDVDTGSYANVRRFLNQGSLPPGDAVRVEEMLNYFRYDYPLPTDRSRPFSVTTNVTKTPWNPNTRLLRIGLRGYDLARRERPAANLVFLVDTSGSMQEPDKLPLVKASLALLADKLGPKDRVSIVAYAGSAGLVLAPTNDPAKIKAAIEQLSAGGSTAGGQGIELAYATARANKLEDGINRILLATDGDFNVGIADTRALKDMVRRNRDDGITLTTLGYGQGNYNEAMMEQIADVGNGNYSYVDSAMEAQKVLDQELSSTLFTIAKDVKVQVEFNPAAVSEYRLIGYENRLLREEDFDNDEVDAGDIGAGHMVTALYEIVPAGAQGWLPDRRYEANQAAVPLVARRELAFLKLRYKLPNEETSRLIDQPIPMSAIAGARAPEGDMAFAAAVAAYGQKLKGDTRIGSFSWNEVRRLAGSPSDYWRQEFVKLVDLAASRQPPSAGGE
jgi:Ca-activated chloride channel family protein